MRVNAHSVPNEKIIPDEAAFCLECGFHVVQIIDSKETERKWKRLDIEMVRVINDQFK